MEALVIKSLRALSTSLFSFKCPVTRRDSSLNLALPVFFTTGVIVVSSVLAVPVVIALSLAGVVSCFLEDEEDKEDEEDEEDVLVHFRLPACLLQTSNTWGSLTGASLIVTVSGQL